MYFRYNRRRGPVFGSTRGRLLTWWAFVRYSEMAKYWSSQACVNSLPLATNRFECHQLTEAEGRPNAEHFRLTFEVATASVTEAAGSTCGRHASSSNESAASVRFSRLQRKCTLFEAAAAFLTTTVYTSFFFQAEESPNLMHL